MKLVINISELPPPDLHYIYIYYNELHIYIHMYNQGQKLMDKRQNLCESSIS